MYDLTECSVGVCLRNWIAPYELLECGHAWESVVHTELEFSTNSTPFLLRNSFLVVTTLTTSQQKLICHMPDLLTLSLLLQYAMNNFELIVN